MIEHPDSMINIKNIAICVYGQYRTGDACLEYIQKFYKSKGYNVDFFCSLKPYTTTYTRHVYNKQEGKDIWHQDITPTEELKHQLDQIKKYLSPKLINMYSKEYEDELMDIDKTIVQSKVLAGWVDVIMLKQQYEVDNDITYDLVVMQRYDTIIYPSAAFRTILKSLNDVPVSRRDSYQTADKNFLLMNPIKFIREATSLVFYPNGQDMWVLGVGTALDSLAYEFLKYIPSKSNNMQSTTKFYDGFPFIDTHEAIATAADKINIPRFAFPHIYPNDRCFPPFENINRGHNRPIVNTKDDKMRPVAPLLIRDLYFKDNIMPNLATFSDDEIEKLYDKSAPKWAAGI